MCLRLFRNRWIPCDKQMPKSGQLVLVCLFGTIWTGYYSHGRKAWKVVGLDMLFTFERISHWMPVPELPQERP